MRLILVILLFVSSVPVHAQKLSPRDTVTDVYRGVLPCAVCIGIDTKLVLVHERFAGMGTYILTETYLHRGDTVTFTQFEGEWTHLRGSAADLNATVIELFHSSDDQFRYYLKQKDGSLKMLDKQLREMPGKGNYVLKK
jgi:hypothetical protein